MKIYAFLRTLATLNFMMMFKYSRKRERERLCVEMSEAFARRIEFKFLDFFLLSKSERVSVIKKFSSSHIGGEERKC